MPVLVVQGAADRVATPGASGEFTEAIRSPDKALSLVEGGRHSLLDDPPSNASTATRAKSKSKQLEKLEVIEIASDEPTAVIRAPQVEPRKGPAVRCRSLAIGYPEREIAKDIDVEIEHGSRAAIVGDNGRGRRRSSARLSIPSRPSQEK